MPDVLLRYGARRLRHRVNNGVACATSLARGHHQSRQRVPVETDQQRTAVPDMEAVRVEHVRATASQRPSAGKNTSAVCVVQPSPNRSSQLRQILARRKEYQLLAAPRTEQGRGFGGPQDGIRTIVLDSAYSLEGFRSALGSARRLPLARVSVDISVFPDVEVDFEERLNETYADCGCAQGSIALAASAVLLAVLQARSSRSLTGRLAMQQLALLGIAAAAGKVAGLAANRGRLLRMTDELLIQQKD